MTGTLINVATVILGGTLGTLLGERLPPRIRRIVVQGIGLVVLALGMDSALETNNFLLVLGSVLIGGILGEWWQLERRLDGAGKWLEAKAARIPFLTRGEFVRGFVTASLIFCAGPMTVLGSIQDGLSGDYTLLAIKSVLDGFSALAFAAAMGMGVTFAALAVLIIQGALTLGAFLFESILTTPMITELTAVGGIIMLGLGLTMLEIKRIKVANFLPALIVAPLLAALVEWLSLR
ncbi:MAG: hypothetical protein B6I35_07445 [Anaerolineaceae bacterium 4572_32.2]|nr:MAG: hypothetical protein B6I35_07445 [Anaerolineaceae bacterium 4572_32.2]RLC75263.1 MAG: DUF554 domain-containing protein [Chloroflexota bacterium]HEY73078.1 DUF554 domain-containing protein [Thermoflexia bacterium]